MPHIARPDATIYAFNLRDLPPGDRPAARLRQHGAGALSSAELLAIVIGAADGLALAQSLLIRFGGLLRLEHAPLTELVHAGLFPTQALRLKAALALGQRLPEEVQEARRRRAITSPQHLAELVMSEMALLEQEHLVVIALDNRNHVVAIETVYRGNVSTAVVRPAEVFRLAVRVGAPVIAVAHNHPSGDVTPSAEDIQVTRILSEAARLLGITLIDHLVIGKGQFTSFKARELAL